MKTTVHMIAAALAFGAAMPAAAQQIDVAAITCEEVAAMPAESLVMMIAFIDGYTGGEAGDSVLDIDRLNGDLTKVGEICTADPKATLMDAMKAALAG